MLTVVRVPTIVVAGIRRAGLGMLGDMLRAGFIPDACIVFAPDPHVHAPPATPTPIVLALYIDRGTGQLAQSIARQNANEGRAPLSVHERRILRRRFTHDFRRARDAAALQFSPLHVFHFESIIADPAAEARRLANIAAGHFEFSQGNAALAVRRILNPRVIDAPYRIVERKP